MKTTPQRISMEMVDQATKIMVLEKENSYQIQRDPQLFRSVVYSVCPNFVITEHNRDRLNILYDYAHGTGVLDPNKGIWIYGETFGNGKSTLIKILGEYQRILSRGFKTVNCASLSAEFSTYGIESLNESTWNDGIRGVSPVERAFDELGRENIPAKYYGNELNIMQHILQIRYDLKIKTHITTNMKIYEIENKYGSHIYDRCIEMFNFIELKGESFRK